MRAARPTALILVALVAFACGKKADDKKGDDKSADDKSAPTASYDTRGVVKAIAADEINIHHETIDGFVSRSGKTIGMMSMSMPFAIADGVSVADLAPGDKVAFTFAVDFSANPPSRVTTIKKLPADTELSISGH